RRREGQGRGGVVQGQPQRHCTEAVPGARIEAMSLKLGGYTRLSKDRYGTETATKRQREDYEKWAKANGHKIVSHYRDSDLSAYKDRKSTRLNSSHLVIS